MNVYLHTSYHIEFPNAKMRMKKDILITILVHYVFCYFVYQPLKKMRKSTKNGR